LAPKMHTGHGLLLVLRLAISESSLRSKASRRLR